MSAFASLGLDAITLGFEYSLLAVGVYITFRILGMADLTVDGSFCLGMSVGTVVTLAGHPVLGLIAGMAAGAVAGCVTGGLITGARINPLLAGIITMTGLYSVNVFVLGAPNLTLLSCVRVYEPFSAMFGLNQALGKLALAILVVAVVIAVLVVYFHTESGLGMRATGNNEAMCRASSLNTNFYKVLGLAMANGLVGLTGALLAQYQGFADVNSGSGMVMVGLASVILGEVIGGKRSVTAGIVCAVFGSVIYRIVVQAALKVNVIDSNALKLVTAVLVALFMSAPALRAYLAERRSRAASRKSAESYPAVPADSMLDLRGVTKTFNAGTPMEHTALDGVELSLDRGDFACIVGSNGAGKSTLFNAIAGSIIPDAGRVDIAAKDVTHTADYRRARSLSRVFQDPMMGTAPDLTVAENVALAYGRSKKSALAFAMRRERREFIRERLASLGFGLEERMDVKVGMLSGGQRQAVTLLMATIGNPDLLLLDEHTAALDPEATQRILDLTRRITAENNTTTLMITHNLGSALEMGDRTLVMDSGRIVANVSGEERSNMDVEDLLDLYRKSVGHDLDDDKVLLEHA